MHVVPLARRRFLQGAIATLALPGLVLAQDKYPSKPITWICPYAAGGSATSARTGSPRP